MRQLQRVVEHLLVLGALQPRRVPAGRRLRHLLLARLAQALVGVPGRTGRAVVNTKISLSL